MVTIRKSLAGRTFGIGDDGELILNKAADGAEIQRLVGAVTETTITSAQLLALNATPQTIVAAPEAGKTVVVSKIVIHKPAGTAYAGIAAGEDLVAKFTDGSGAQCSGVIETTGFLDSTAAETRVVGMPGATGTTAGSYEPVAAAAVVLHLLVGEVTTGDSNLHVRVFYDVIDTVFT